MKDWKTNAAGIGVLAIAAAMLVGRITLDQFLVAFATLTGAGFLAAKDANQP